MAKKIIGDVILTSLYLKHLPDILKDISVVSGHFFCSRNNLTSLDGAPTNVGGDFHCNFNKLTSLIGAPTYVGGDFLCYGNPVKFTESQVRAVCNVKGKVYVK